VGALGPAADADTASARTGQDATSSDAPGAAAATPGSGGGTASGPAGGTTAATKQPIRIGFIGARSGAAGVTVTSARDGWVVWAKAINAKGGINGHPVEVLVGDDGTNDTRGVAIARDFVENKGAIALSWASNDIHGLAAYAQQKRVPIIGVVEGQDVWATNPMMFPTSTGVTGGWGTLRAVKEIGATKAAVIYCVEAATCQTGAEAMKPYQDELGVKITYSAGASLTQPDFTAECIQARNSGAQAVIILMDQNSVVRFMQSCLRQGYKPSPVGPSNDAMAKLPEMDGLVATGANFPWFLRSGAPGVDEYVQALQKFAPNMLTDGSSFQSLSWVAAKVFQHAIENATRTNNPDKLTAEDVLNGLWAMDGDTLDGLAPDGLARTYHQGQPAPKVFCTFVSRLQNGKWTSPSGLTPVCR
jgi:branched-chain amino acid transport system substrate-binding protein